MGSVVVPVKELLAEPQLVLDQWFHLDGAAPESQILLRAELKVRSQTHLPMVAVAQVVEWAVNESEGWLFNPSGPPVRMLNFF